MYDTYNNMYNKLVDAHSDVKIHLLFFFFLAGWDIRCISSGGICPYNIIMDIVLSCVQIV